MHNPELLMAEAYDEGVVSEVIRPAAIIPEESARAVLVELAIRDVQNGGLWQSEPSLWSRYDRPWEGYGNPAGAELIGTDPGRLRHPDPVRDHDLPRHGHPATAPTSGWTVESLCDEALAFGGLDLANCPRASLGAPPKPFKF